jgi:uncharacterized membrane protein YgcG
VKHPLKTIALNFILQKTPFIKNFFLLLFFLFSTYVSAFDVPTFSPNVVDNDGVLSLKQKLRINAVIEEIRDAADLHAAVLFSEPLTNISIEEAAEKTFKSWELGAKKSDNGILLFFDNTNRNARIEVGYGLEANIPDVMAARILDQVILPEFKKKNFSSGVIDGLYALSYLNTNNELFLKKSGGHQIRALIEAETTSKSDKSAFLPPGEFQFLKNAFQNLIKLTVFNIIYITAVRFVFLKVEDELPWRRMSSDARELS